MSSSDDRRRPRVAGHRRRATRPAATPPEVDAEPLTGPDAGAEPAVEAVPDAVHTGAPEVATAPVEGVPDAVDATDADTTDADTTDADDTDADTTTAPLDDDDTGEAPASAGRRGGHRLRRDLLAPVVALVLALAALAVVGWVSLEDQGARQRDARAATAAARADLEQLLSYDHRTIATQATQNTALLTGAFKDEYATTMRTRIAPVAEKEQAVVRARTYEAGVMSQGEDTVTVQVFLNQAKTAKDQEQPSVDQNRVIATMQRVDGRWLLAKLSAY